MIPIAGHRYTAAEMKQMRVDNPGLELPGHVLRLQGGMFTFVPWRQASGGGAREEGHVVRGPRVYELGFDEDPFPVDPIRRRTPQQRVESLTRKFLEDCRRAGKVPGLSDEKVTELTANSWKRGQPFTGEHVRQVAASLLADAENRYEASERKKVVRTSPTD